MEPLPIDPLEPAFLDAWRLGPVVVDAPTGSGKSTRVPVWSRAHGPVLIVQPRRVACRALACRVAEVEGAALGREVGWAVRDERRATDDTGLLFVTTGVALRMVRGGEIQRFATVVLDEIHERSLDLDLLLALLARHPHLIAMSATLDGARIARHLGAAHLVGATRAHPVDFVHPQDAPKVPEPRDLEARVRRAVERAPPEGDILVFLPGKAEIRRVAERLGGLDLEVVALHGGLSLDDQARVFRPATRRKVILATNVAETSLTVPGVRVVIDSGLVRRTRYHHGRSVLTLGPIAQDAADQRAGRAGRTAPGTAVRLWQPNVPLDPATPPALHRESLVPLVLGAAACGAPDLELPWLDPPKPHAVEAARETLRGLGAIGDDHRLTPTGAHLFELPLDPALGRLLIEARSQGDAALHDAVDLCAALALGRPLFRRDRPSSRADDLRRPLPWPAAVGDALDGLDPDGDGGCDATAAVRALREGVPGRHGLDPAALDTARQVRRRLAASLALTGPPLPFDRRRLADALLAAWPATAHVARRRGRRTAWSHGGTELDLADASAVDPGATEAILVLEVRALAAHRLDQQLLCGAAMPVPLAWLREAGLGRDRLTGVDLRDGVAVGVIERVYAGRVLERREEVPEGPLARDAVRDLFLGGRILDLAEARDRHQAQALWARLRGDPPPPALEAWVEARLVALGVESGADVALLDPGDLLPESLDPADRARLDRDFPRALDLGDARYALEYHPARRLLILEKVAGPRKTLPPVTYVPKVPGWRIEVVDRNVRRVLREGRDG
jgi:ATP-dependent helicase HrpB